jgi:hypothetical protein
MHRIFWRHRWLLIASLLIPVAVIAPLRLTRPLTYAATASVQAQATTPDADTQVTAILSRVTAIATSPSTVQSAIKAAGVDRNALAVAQHDVAVTSLGSSAIVTVTVTDPSRRAAVSLARSLANDVVKALNGLGSQSSQELATLGQQRNNLDATRNKVLKQLAAAQASGASATSAAVQAPIAELNAVETELSTNSTSVQQVLASSSVNEGAGVISAPAYATSVSRHFASYTSLAGLLGLVVGLLVATIHELARPTIADPRAGARELGLVFLGDAELTNDELTDLDDELLARLDLAAHRLGARNLVLTGSMPPAQLTALAAHLDRKLPVIVGSADGNGHPPGGSRVRGITTLSAHNSPGASDAERPTGSVSTVSSRALSAGSVRSGLTVAALSEVTLRARLQDPALVLVLSRFAPRAALDQVADLGVTTGWPILGVIGLRLHGRRHRVTAPKQVAGIADKKVGAAGKATEDEMTDAAEQATAGKDADKWGAAR